MTLRQFIAAGNLSAFSFCSKADHPSILLQLGGGLYSKEVRGFFADPVRSAAEGVS